MKTLPATMTLGELVKLSGVPNSTLRRHFAERGIGCTARRYLLADIIHMWPKFHASLLIAVERRPRCPDCFGETERRCLDAECGFRAA